MNRLLDVVINGDVATAAGAGELIIGDMCVRRMGFGAMRITGEGIWGEPKDRKSVHKVLHRAVELGINFIDTADSYGPDVSEELIAEALHPYPEDLVIATKGGLLRPGPGKWTPDCSPKHLRKVCEGSMKRLKVDRIDLYQLHAEDPSVPLEESIGALAELQSEGKIRHIGVSNFDTEQLERARAIAEIVSVQNLYNLAERSAETVVKACEREGLTFIPWFPLATGSLALVGGVLAEIAEAHGATPAQVSLAWLQQHSPVVLPIPGTASIAHLEENIAASEFQLTHEDLARLESSL